MSGVQVMHVLAETSEFVSLCTLQAGDRQFGLDTRRIREVLGRRDVQAVPLAPAFIGGVLPYRGEVLTAVSFRALLGLPALRTGSYVLVLGGEASDGTQGDERRERFGLMVDNVCGVAMMERRTRVANPTSLDEASRQLFSGAYRAVQGLLVELNPDNLSPANVAASGMFAGCQLAGDERAKTKEGDAACGH